LRMMETRTVRRVGETTSRPVDTRIVAATHRGDEVFREDFRGRFGLVVELKPLRKRKEDIPLLARQKLIEAVKEDPERRERLFFQGPSGRLEPRMSLFFVDYLARHPLKRNTRELKEICLKALLTSEGDEITLPGLEPDPEVAPAETPVDEKGRGTTKSISKDELLMALQHCGNNKTQAAKLLGLGRTAMYDLMARHGVKRGNDSTA